MLSYAATIDAMKTSTEWVLANTNVTGYYRVHYDEANWERLLDTLSNNHEVRREAPAAWASHTDSNRRVGDWCVLCPVAEYSSD